MDQHAPPPDPSLLAEIYRHLPVLVVVLTTDGVVLYCNPMTAQATGFREHELIGKNFWATLFPGRLFAQVPKFVSTIHPGELLGNDVPLTLRTRDGQERTIAWTRSMCRGAERTTIVCFGKDLTDRLLASDTAADETTKGANDGRLAGFGPGVGNAGTVEGEVVTPLAISPPVLPSANTPVGSGAIQEVHEFLIGIEKRVEELETAFSHGEMAALRRIADALQHGAYACGLLEFSTRAESLQVAAAAGRLEQVTRLVHQIVSMCKIKGGVA